MSTPIINRNPWLPIFSTPGGPRTGFRKGHSLDGAAQSLHKSPPIHLCAVHAPLMLAFSSFSECLSLHPTGSAHSGRSLEEEEGWRLACPGQEGCYASATNFVGRTSDGGIFLFCLACILGCVVSPQLKQTSGCFLPKSGSLKQR